MSKRKHYNNINNEDESTKPKERRIVTWTQQEDDILREQISKHGTNNWTIIASMFKDKTTRQCRRRWYTYLNSDFKKGGWSPEEDMLLCEAQKIFGNRWTEIAKVVSGRTDNAVKNRFSTLCKKKAKSEALAKENINPSINANNKRVLVDNKFCSSGMIDVPSPFKSSRRAHIPSRMENPVSENILQKDCGISKPQLRHPFAVLPHNDSNVRNSLVSPEVVINADKKTKGTFIRKDDPKVAALVRQAELLSSLAVRVNVDNTEKSLENAWKVLQNYIGKSKATEKLECKITDKYESSSSSECSTSSASLSQAANDQGEQSQPEICTMHEEIGDVDRVELTGTKEILCTTVDKETNSPVQVTPVFKTLASLIGETCSPFLATPIFRSLASTIPSPQFSESERHFLLKTLGFESPSHNNINNPLQAPPCRKALLQGL